MQHKSFDELYELVRDTQQNIAQMTVLRHGQTVFSAEWNGFQPDDCAHVMSVTKSVVALLVGIAVDRGYIKSIDAPVLDFFPDYTVKRGEKTIRGVTVRHLLTMTAPYKCKTELWTRVCTSNDWTVAALDLMGGRSGITGAFRYSTLGIQALCGILERVCGVPPLGFANDALFAPLGIAPRKPFCADTAEEHKAFTLSQAPKEKLWFTDPRGVPTAGFGLCLSSCDMAKIGQLCLSKGIWCGKRILSGEWIEQITAPSSPTMDAFGGMRYGMLWWIVDAEQGIYAASGTGGNVVYVHPALDAVIAVAATFKPSVYDRIPFIEKHILPCIR